MTILKQFLCAVLLYTSLSQTMGGNWQNWLSEQFKSGSSLLQKSIWQPVCKHISFAQPSAEFLVEHKKASLLVGAILGYTAYKWYDNKKSTWSLLQGSGTTMPACLGNINGASPSQPSYDARFHIIDTIAKNSNTLSDILYSLHNRGKTDSLLPWASNTMPEGKPRVTIKAMLENIECFKIETSVNVNEDDPIKITLRNSKNQTMLTGQGSTLFVALQKLSEHIIRKNEPHNVQGLPRTIDMTEAGWNPFCGNELDVYKISATSPSQQQPLQFICETKVRKYMQPANKSIASAGKIGSSLKDATYFQTKIASCFQQQTLIIDQTSEIISTIQEPLIIDQASGTVPKENENDQEFYDFRYHLYQFIQKNLHYIIFALNKQNTPTKNLLTITFRGTIINVLQPESHTFDLTITYLKQTKQIIISLKNNQTNSTPLRFGTDNSLHACLNEMLDNLAPEALNTWCDESLRPIQINDENDQALEVPTFTDITPINHEDASGELLEELKQIILRDFGNN